MALALYEQRLAQILAESGLAELGLASGHPAAEIARERAYQHLRSQLLAVDARMLRRQLDQVAAQLAVELGYVSSSDLARLSDAGDLPLAHALVRAGNIGQAQRDCLLSEIEARFHACPICGGCAERASLAGIAECLRCGYPLPADASRVRESLRVGDPTDPLVGRRLDGFQVIRKLGQGGMGAVYLARDPLGEMVAVKVLPFGLGGSGEWRTRFARESTAAAAISSPHVVRVLGAGRTEEIDWLAMEYVEGSSLGERLRKGGALAPAEVVRVARQVAVGLAAVHAAGLVHRDLKPDNVLLDTQGLAKIADFGLARDLAATTISVSGAVMGSPGFMAPEQAKGERAGPAADLFSFGVLIHAMCTGQSPFARPHLLASLRAVIDDPIPPLCRACPTAPTSLQRLVGELAAKLPARRPAGLAPVLAALARIEAELGVTGAAATLVVPRSVGAEPPVGKVAAPAEPPGAAPAPAAPARARGAALTGPTSASRGIPTAVVIALAIAGIGALVTAGALLVGSMVGEPITDALRARNDPARVDPSEDVPLPIAPPPVFPGDLKDAGSDRTAAPGLRASALTWPALVGLVVDLAGLGAARQTDLVALARAAPVAPSADAVAALHARLTSLGVGGASVRAVATALDLRRRELSDLAATRASEIARTARREAEAQQRTALNAALDAWIDATWTLRDTSSRDAIGRWRAAAALTTLAQWPVPSDMRTEGLTAIAATDAALRRYLRGSVGERVTFALVTGHRLGGEIIALRDDAFVLQLDSPGAPTTEVAIEAVALATRVDWARAELVRASNPSCAAWLAGVTCALDPTLRTKARGLLERSNDPRRIAWLERVSGAEETKPDPQPAVPPVGLARAEQSRILALFAASGCPVKVELKGSLAIARYTFDGAFPPAWALEVLPVELDRHAQRNAGGVELKNAVLSTVLPARVEGVELVLEAMGEGEVVVQTGGIHARFEVLSAGRHVLSWKGKEWFDGKNPCPSSDRGPNYAAVSVEVRGGSVRVVSAELRMRWEDLRGDRVAACAAEFGAWEELRRWLASDTPGDVRRWIGEGAKKPWDTELRSGRDGEIRQDGTRLQLTPGASLFTKGSYEDVHLAIEYCSAACGDVPASITLRQGDHDRNQFRLPGVTREGRTFALHAWCAGVASVVAVDGIRVQPLLYGPPTPRENGFVRIMSGNGPMRVYAFALCPVE